VNGIELLLIEIV